MEQKVTTHSICILCCWCFQFLFVLLQTIFPIQRFYTKYVREDRTKLRQKCVNSITSLSSDSPMLAQMNKREEPTSQSTLNIASRGSLPKTFVLRRCFIFFGCCCLKQQQKNVQKMPNSYPFSNNLVMHQYLSKQVILNYY